MHNMALSDPLAGSSQVDLRVPSTHGVYLMQLTKIAAQRGNEPPVEVEVEIADDLEELRQQYGDDVVFSHAKRSVIIALQAYMRSLMDQGREKGQDAATTANTIVEQVRGWKPSQKKAPKTVQEKARDILSKLSPADRALLIKEFRAKKETEAAAA